MRINGIVGCQRIERAVKAFERPPSMGHHSLGGKVTDQESVSDFSCLLVLLTTASKYIQFNWAQLYIFLSRA